MFNFRFFAKKPVQPIVPTMPEPLAQLEYLNILYSDALLCLKINNYRAYDWCLNEIDVVKPMNRDRYAQYCAQRWENYVNSLKGAA